MRKVLAFLFTGLVLWGVYWFAATRLFDEGSYRKQVALGSVFVPYGWAYALGVILLLALLIFFYSLAYTALVNRLQGRRKSPWPLFLQGITHLFLWVLILLVYYPVVQVVAASFDPTNNLFSFKRPNTGFLLLDAKVIPYLPEPSLENYARLVEGVVLYPCSASSSWRAWPFWGWGASGFCAASCRRRSGWASGREGSSS